jgi:hypothetical protein
MVDVLLGCAILLLALLLGRLFTRANPHQLVRGARILGGLALLALTVFLATRGVFVLVIPFGLASLGLLGLSGFWGARSKPSQGRISRVRTAVLEMELDHDSGAMRGQFLAGPHAGTPLDALPVATLAALLPDIDEQSRSLLMAYLERRDPAWSAQARTDGSAGSAGAGAGGAAAPSAKMTVDEAYLILGVKPGASAEEIGHAHRTLMKKLHPDQGGSTYLAARVNEAKDTLLRRHRGR